MSATMRRAIEFYLAIFSDCPRRSIQLRMARRPPLIIASDAQVEPDIYPGGGYLIYHPETLSRTGAWCEFKDRELAMLKTSMRAIADGAQPIAKFELAMLPILLYEENERIAGRDIIWLVDNTAALGGIVKGASGLAVSELLIAAFWMKAFALQVRLWIEYIDSAGNWSDGISREFGNDPYSQKHHFDTRRIGEPMQWFTTDVKHAWERVVLPLGT